MYSLQVSRKVQYAEVRGYHRYTDAHLPILLVCYAVSTGEKLPKFPMSITPPLLRSVSQSLRLLALYDKDATWATRTYIYLMYLHSIRYDETLSVPRSVALRLCFSEILSFCELDRATPPPPWTNGDYFPIHRQNKSPDKIFSNLQFPHNRLHKRHPSDRIHMT